MMRALYSLLVWALQPVLRRKLAQRARTEPGYAVAVPERFGHYTMPATRGAVWIHAVSLGETRAAGVLMRALRAQHPGVRFVLTHGTATGRQEGAALLQPGDVQVWQPWDTVAAATRFVQHFRPCVGVLMETEVWPNVAHACAQAGVALVLANARMSEKTLRQTRRLAWLARPVYQSLRAVWAQTAPDAQRLQLAGARHPEVLGNLKFDATPNAAQCAQGQHWRRAQAKPVLMLASSRDGEEQLYLEALQRHPEWLRAAVWLIVPRHPQRFDAVARLAAQLGVPCERRSAWGAAPESCPVLGDSAVVLGDSLGEMALYYSWADVCLLGGSFAPLGGQNLIEAAACGCPVVMGAHTFNFAQAAELAQACGAAQQVQGLEEGMALALQWARDPVLRAHKSQQALDFAQAHRGAVDRTVQRLLTWVQAEA